MIKRIVTYGTLGPLLVLLLLWAHHNTERFEHRTDQTVCRIRQGC
ncbi:hypothetical protein [Symbioplanes lichenis]|nr:hypothetical protein [Actinoplanes lichenis]